MVDQNASPIIPQTPIRLEASPTQAWAGSLIVKLTTNQTRTGPIKIGSKVGSVVLVEKVDSEGEVLGQTAHVSVGELAKINQDTIRRAGGSISRWLATHDLQDAAIDVDSLDQLPVQRARRALCEGLILGAFRYDRHKSIQESAEIRTLTLLTDNGVDDLKRVINHSAAVAFGVNLARDWAHEPPNVINPVTLAERAKLLAERIGLSCTVLDEQKLANMNAGAILSVGLGSKTPSRLIVLSYTGNGATDNTSPVIILGKAITFDTGGYSLKTKNGIVGMKYDKCGGMAVIGIMHAVAALKPKVPVVGIIAASENMISENAYRPNDIITTMSGKTVEIISADAEGRLVLADALTYAQETFQPRALIDLATLTGGIITALGDVRAGLMANDDQLANALFSAGEKTHERLWRMPLDEDYFELIRGDDSDLKNSGARKAHPIIGGIFLKQFVSDEIPWAHLDIAGTATTDKDINYCPKGATGFGVRLLIEYIEGLK